MIANRIRFKPNRLRNCPHQLIKQKINYVNMLACDVREMKQLSGNEFSFLRRAKFVYLDACCCILRLEEKTFHSAVGEYLQFYKTMRSLGRRLNECGKGKSNSKPRYGLCNEATAHLIYKWTHRQVRWG